MKIVNFDEFALMPEGTVYSDYRPVVCEGLYRKGKTIFRDATEPIDFFLSSFIADCWNGEHPDSNGDESRWGLFEWEASFVIYEKDDVKKLVDRLTA